MQKLSSAFYAAISSFIALSLLYPQAGYALGLGKLSVESNLGQPLRLEIQLDSVTSVEAETLDVSLASRSDFSRAGVEYPVIAGLLNFELAQSPDGGYVVVITTEDVLQETYLHLLVSALWSGGKAVREYTALLDPPLYSGQAASDVTLAGSEEGQTISEEAEETATRSAASGSEFGEVVVRKGDTLSQIVNDISKPDNVNYFQALEAVYRSNPEAFIDNNMNLLRSGATLKIPSFEEMQAVSRRESLASFTAQLEKFNAYKASVSQQQQADSSETMDQLIEEESAVSADEAAPEPAPEVDTASQVVEPEAEPTTDEQEVVQESEVQAIETEEATLTIGQQIEEDAAVEGDNAAELEALKAQLAELDESLLAGGVENESVRNNLRQIQNQVERISTLIEVEDTGLAMAQTRAAELESDTAAEVQAAEGTAEEQAMAEIEEAIANVDESASVTDQSEASQSETSQSESTDAVETAGVDPEASVEGEISNEAEQAEMAQQQSEAPAVVEPQVAEESGVATETAVTEQEDSEEVAQLAAAEQVQPPAAEEVDSGDQGAIGSAARQVAKSGLLDSIKGMFSGLPDYGLKIAAGLLALLAGLFLWQRRKSRKEFDASMLDIETEEVSMNSETTIKKMSDASGIDLASSNDSALELTIGGGMSYLSEEGITGVNEEENEVIKAGAVDPLAEADVYLAYDRDEQAIQVLKEAYADDPERGELAEKLLEIYHKQDDRRSFDALATELHKRQDSTQNLSWEKVISMGKEVSPDNPLYSGEAPVAAAETSASIDLEEELLEGLQAAPAKQAASEEGMLSMDDDGLDLELDIMKAGIEGPDLKDEVNDLEIDDLEIDFEKEDVKKDDIEEEVSGIDAPTLSQIISENAESPLNLDKESVEIRDSDLDEISLNAGELDLDLGKDEDKQFNQIEEEANRAVVEASKEEATEKKSAMNSIDQHSGMSEMSQLEPYHESETALELAKAYLELGEQEIAKGFIEEVLNEGSEKQKGKARKLIKELAS
ncbi:MAG: FimV/HubP family polar landmark protein [bacterium]